MQNAVKGSKVVNSHIYRKMGPNVDIQHNYGSQASLHHPLAAAASFDKGGSDLNNRISMMTGGGATVASQGTLIGQGVRVSNRSPGKVGDRSRQSYN